ncbi:GntR family transcriptional regulator [Streptomyces sp. NPDC048256]|uniref:GntR family transcriptional regulator n=1 Tax=Streptomyces sp. NPDC048256 TaxID=3154613 RepID=UPI00340C0DCA
MTEQDTHLVLERLLRLRDRREPLVAQIAEWVGAGIIEGRLEPGQDLNSVDLSRRFETSRTPVREALMLLEQEGLVEMKARRRPRVAAPTPQDIRDIYQVRKNLLSMLAGLLVERADDEELAELRTRVERMRKLADGGDVDGYFWNHVLLQERMAEIVGNPTLKQILDSLALRTLMLRHLSLTRAGRLAHSVDDQERLLQACEERDGELASALIAGATVRAQRAVEEQLEQDGAARGREPARGRRAASQPPPRHPLGTRHLASTSPSTGKLPPVTRADSSDAR